ncbi:glycosyl transferase [Synechococcus sp. HK01-R]|uniref:glycosyl transferase n=1 Tax=Synechococcus sp. HK01-R TaxID=2751171 RepID=UPI001626D417|nr:glycosyl transferase [Synechococcus sp. HK01-R]QNG28046.1 glycosyl transferase [Synechococcus sp. HK01-R]
MDFQQGLIATIHDYGLGNLDLPGFRRQLQQRPTVLLIPCLMEEFSRPALGLIRDVLGELQGLHELVIALAADSPEDVAAAEAFFSGMPFPVRVHWTNGPAVRELLESMRELGLDVTGPAGKGWAVWQGLGVACRQAEVIGLFDADIRTFSPAYPERMLRPLLDPSHGVAYVKAFYSRLSLETQALQGRATRLFVGPLLASLEQIFGPLPYLRYLQGFRYPLAGEFAFSRDLAMNLRIPSDWGLEIGLLSEVYRHVASSRIAQVDLGLFDHKHKTLGATPAEGLQRMAAEILRTVLRGVMEHEGRSLAPEELATLEVLYRRVGEDRVRQFGLDSAINRLPYDRHSEELALQSFATLLKPGIHQLMETPVAHQLPSWSRLVSCTHGLQNDLAAAGSIKSSSITALHQRPTLRHRPATARRPRPAAAPAA